MEIETSRSKLYQHKIVEISFDQSKLNNFPEDSGISSMLADNETDDRIQALREDLLEEIYEIVHGDFLTDHQKKILMMRLVGKTQNEIAEHLGITQSAVHKALHGNIDYKNDKKRYGGIIKKLKKICNNNPNIQYILQEIEKVKNTENPDNELSINKL
jgi:DNA-binding CsgD family transcriptional regulator